MWWSKKKKTTLDIASELKESFSSLDFDDVNKMKALKNKCIKIQSKLNTNISALGNKLSKCTEKLDSYNSRKDIIEAQIKELRKIINDLSLAGTKDPELRKNVLEFRMLTSKSKALDREYKDYSKSMELFNNMLADVNDATHIIEHMIDSLDRNIERVEAANLLLYNESDIGNEEIKITDAIYATTTNINKLKKYDSGMLKKLKEIDKRLDSLSENVDTNMKLDIGEFVDSNTGYPTMYQHRVQKACEDSKGFSYIYRNTCAKSDKISLMKLFKEGQFHVLEEALKSLPKFIKLFDRLAERKSELATQIDEMANTLSRV
jgi:chaperonin cofactor prefoldin